MLTFEPKLTGEIWSLTLHLYSTCPFCVTSRVSLHPLLANNIFKVITLNGFDYSQPILADLPMNLMGNTL